MGTSTGESPADAGGSPLHGAVSWLWKFVGFLGFRVERLAFRAVELGGGALVDQGLKHRVRSRLHGLQSVLEVRGCRICGHLGAQKAWNSKVTHGKYS